MAGKDVDDYLHNLFTSRSEPTASSPAQSTVSDGHNTHQHDGHFTSEASVLRQDVVFSQDSPGPDPAHQPARDDHDEADEHRRKRSRTQSASPSQGLQADRFREFLEEEERRGVVRLHRGAGEEAESPIGVAGWDVENLQKWWEDAKVWFEDEPGTWTESAFFMALRRIGFRALNDAGPPASVGHDFGLKRTDVERHGYVYDQGTLKRYNKVLHRRFTAAKLDRGSPAQPADGLPAVAVSTLSESSAASFLPSSPSLFPSHGFPSYPSQPVSHATFLPPHPPPHPPIQQPHSRGLPAASHHTLLSPQPTVAAPYPADFVPSPAPRRAPSASREPELHAEVEVPNSALPPPRHPPPPFRDRSPREPS